MSPITSTIEFMELFWTNNNGEEYSVCFPKDKAELMFSKHLIPQKESGSIRDAGIRKAN